MNKIQTFNDNRKLKSLEINKYGNQSACPHIQIHFHSEYELVYVKNGKGTIRIAGYEQEYENGTLVLLGPFIPHIGFANRDFEDNYEVVLHFSEEFVRNQLQLFPEFKRVLNMIDESGRVIVFNNELKKDLTGIFEKLNEQNPMQQLVDVLGVMVKMCVQGNHRKLLPENYSLDLDKSKRFRVILDYINENFTSNISTADVAEKLNLTTNSFCRLFKKMSDKSFMDYLNEFRINNAAFLLEWGSFNVSEAMLRSGFSNLSYFTKQFRKYKNISPSEYRKKFKNIKD